MIIRITIVSTILELPSLLISPHETSIAMPDDNVMWRFPVLFGKIKSAPVTFFHILRQVDSFPKYWNSTIYKPGLSQQVGLSFFLSFLFLPTPTTHTHDPRPTTFS